MFPLVYHPEENLAHIRSPIFQHCTDRALLFVTILTLSCSTLPAQYAFAPPRPAGGINDCDFCLAAQGISPLEVGASGFRVDVRFLRLATAFRNGAAVDNPEQELETHLTQQYSFFYGLSSRFSLAGLLPVSRRHSERLTEEGVRVTGTEFGMGDIVLLFRYKALVEHAMESTTILSFTAGTRLPTGRTGGMNSQGEHLDAHMQLGTGSTDILGGISGFIAVDRTALILNFLGGFVTGGANGHRFGDNLNYDLTVRFRVYPSEYDETQFFAALGVNGEWRGREREDGIADENSGGNVTYVTPGFQIYFSPIISFEASFQYPIIHALNGEQLGEDFRMTCGLQVLLP
jgi:hypothetical protein